MSRSLCTAIASALLMVGLAVAAPPAGRGGGGGGFSAGGGRGMGPGGGGFGGSTGRGHVERSPSHGSPRSGGDALRGNAARPSGPVTEMRPSNAVPRASYLGDVQRGNPGRQIGAATDVSRALPVPRAPHAPVHQNFGPVVRRHPSYVHWYHGDWHSHWIRPWYYGPVTWVSVGFVTGAVIWDAPWHWGYWSYYNPYYTEVIVVERTVIDYSRPIVLAAPAGSADPTDPATAEREATQLLDASRIAFARADYEAAMALVNQAIARKPNDPVLHEVRALILFARGQYKPAAAAIYAVLSVGPGWDWPTLSGFYADPSEYTRQLRIAGAVLQHTPGAARNPLLAGVPLHVGRTDRGGRG